MVVPPLVALCVHRMLSFAFDVFLHLQQSFISYAFVTNVSSCSPLPPYVGLSQSGDSVLTEWYKNKKHYFQFCSFGRTRRAGKKEFSLCRLPGLSNFARRGRVKIYPDFLCQTQFEKNGRFLCFSILIESIWNSKNKAKGRRQRNWESLHMLLTWCLGSVEDALQYWGLHMLLTWCLGSRTHVSTCWNIKV